MSNNLSNNIILQEKDEEVLAESHLTLSLSTLIFRKVRNKI